MLDRLARLADRDASPVERDRARVRRFDPEEGVRDVGGAGADQAEEADDLAAADVEAHVLEVALT